MKENLLTGQAQTAMDHDLEDDVLIVEEREKRAGGRLKKTTLWWLKIEGCWKLIIYHRRLPRGKPTGRNKNLKFECPWIGEYTGISKTSAFAEVIQSSYGLLHGDKN